MIKRDLHHFHFSTRRHESLSSGGVTLSPADVFYSNIRKRLFVEPAMEATEVETAYYDTVSPAIPFEGYD